MSEGEAAPPQQRVVISSLFKYDKVLLLLACFSPTALLKLRRSGRLFFWRLDDKKIGALLPSVHHQLGVHPASAHEFCAHGETELVWVLIALGLVNLKTRDAEGSTLLQRAAHSGELSCVQLLVQCGASLNAKGAYGYTPLHECAYLGSPALLRYVLERRANPDALSKNGSTPLLVAAREGLSPICKLLLQFQAHPDDGGDKGWSPLLLAAAQGHEPVVSLLLSCHAQVNQNALNPKDSKIAGPPGQDLCGGRTALHEAAENGHTKCCELLIQASADVEAKDKEGRLPSALALAAGHEELARVLSRDPARELYSLA